MEFFIFQTHLLRATSNEIQTLPYNSRVGVVRNINVDIRKYDLRLHSQSLYPHKNCQYPSW